MRKRPHAHLFNAISEQLESRRLFSVPTDVALANQLISNISSVNNNYSYGSPVVTWAGLNGATKYATSADCSNFETLLLEQAYSFSSSQIQGWTGHTLPQAIDYYNAALADKGFTGFTQYADLQVGDAVFFNYTNDPDANGDTGHVVTIEALPSGIDTKYSTSTQLAYDVTVDDCTGSPHSNDTRTGSETGVGRGQMRFYTNLAGNLVAYSWGLSSSSTVEPMSLRSAIFAKMPAASGNTFLAAGSQANWNAANDSLVITGPSAIIADPGSSQQPVISDSGQQLLIMPGANSTIHLASLTLSGGAVATVFAPSSGQHLLDIAANVGNGVVSVDSTSTLDLQGNDMIVHGGTLATINSLIARGYNAGGSLWKGTGITSSTVAGDTTHLTALGAILNSSGSGALYSSFDGVSAASSDVLVRYTYVGDTNLDGKIDASDYSRIDAGFLTQTLPTGRTTGWANGDFNYDGAINGSDYTLIDNAFNEQSSLIAFTPSAQIAAAEPPAAKPPLVMMPSEVTTAADVDPEELKKARKTLAVDLIQSVLSQLPASHATVAANR
jgi:hypothetical protein